jgi:hypothetical protein
VPFDRRTITLLIALAVIGAPALVVRALCFGKSCDNPADAAPEVPFCSLPPETRQLLSAGYREGRSPEVLTVAREPGIAGITGRANIPIPWPALGDHPETRVPLGFSGAGIDPDAKIPSGTPLDAVAQTEAAILGFDRPFPNVRAGEAVPGLAAGEPPRLLLELVVKGLGSDDLGGGAWPNLMRLLDAGPSTMDARTGSLPVDPSAVLTTLGAGGPPRQHGVTGSLIRNDDGALVPAFSRRASVPVIAALADDLDEALGQRPRIGLVAPAITDRGAIGGRWYLKGDRDDVVIARRGQLRAARALLGDGYGADRVPDLLVTVLEEARPEQDAGLPRLLAAAEKASRGSLTVVVTGTGAFADRAEASASEIATSIEDTVESHAEVVEAAVAGALFLDQDVLAREELSEDLIVEAVNRLENAAGGLLFGDTFSAIAVSFARFC